MSSKLNAEELAKARQANSDFAEWTGDMEWAYCAAIKEVAQPIADQRDELRNALEMLSAAWLCERSLLEDDNPEESVVADTFHFGRKAWDVTAKLLAKYPKQ